MTDIQNELKTIFSNTINALQNAEALLNAKTTIRSIVIDKSFFDLTYMHHDIRESTNHKALFDELKTIRKPVLYWFTFETTKNKEIRDTYEEYRENMRRDITQKDYRNTASYKKGFSPKTQTLYVGKVETGFWGRLITHLGYAKSEKTASMQLAHWYDIPTFGNLQVHYIPFDEGMKYSITTIEKELALKLKPLIGRY